MGDTAGPVRRLHRTHSGLTVNVPAGIARTLRLDHGDYLEFYITPDLEILAVPTPTRARQRRITRDPPQPD